MARGDGGDDGYGRRNKRRCGSAGDEDEEISRHERCRVPAGDYPDAGNGGGCDGSGDDDDGDCTGEDDMYDYSDDSEGYLEEEEPKADELPAAAAPNKGYTVLTEDDILKRQQDAAADVAEVLSIPSSLAAVLLRHFKWRTSRVKDEWFSDDRHVRDAVGLLPADGVPVPMALSRRDFVCGICFGGFGAGETRSAGCAHYYCDECWRGYIHAAVGDGPRCLSLRCPDPACPAAVVQDLVAAAADAADRDRYARFALRSYVEESSGGVVKWCPAAGCTRAVELAGGARDVFCDCRHGFCWACSEEAHRPVSCDMVRAWLAKNRSDSETTNWVLANTKHCPKCRRPIEKNQGCNHMTCSAPCGLQFCWLCSDPWDGHRKCSRYEYEVQPREPGGGEKSGGGGRGKAAAWQEEVLRRRQAKASLDRYLYHYERWAANRGSLRKALEDMDELRLSGLERIAAALEVPAADLGFLTRAYELVADGRRVMRWVYAYGYFLDPVRDAAKRRLFDHLQDDANSRLESLHSCAELERRKFDAGAAEDRRADAMNEMYRAYKKKLEDLTSATRHYFGNLVKAFEADMPEFNSVKK